MNKRSLITLLVLSVLSAACSTPIIVDSEGDAPDSVLDGACATADNVCTLRAAIQEANY